MMWMWVDHKILVFLNKNYVLFKNHLNDELQWVKDDVWVNFGLRWSFKMCFRVLPVNLIFYKTLKIGWFYDIFPQVSQLSFKQKNKKKNTTI